MTNEIGQFCSNSYEGGKDRLVMRLSIKI